MDGHIEVTGDAQQRSLATEPGVETLRRAMDEGFACSVISFSSHEMGMWLMGKLYRLHTTLSEVRDLSSKRIEVVSQTTAGWMANRVRLRTWYPVEKRAWIQDAQGSAERFEGT